MGKWRAQNHGQSIELQQAPGAVEGKQVRVAVV